MSQPVRHKPRSPIAYPPADRAVAYPNDYQRERDLPKLLPLLECDLMVATPAQHARLLSLIRRALRAERRRGLANDWCYDVARHANLLRAYRLEATFALRLALPSEPRPSPTIGTHPEARWSTSAQDPSH